jgi:four helix bundle protein
MAGARHYSELEMWKLADQVRVEIVKLTSRPAIVRDLKAHGHMDDAANSAYRNIAEGFGCDTHPESIRFLGISRRSLNELPDGLRGAELKGYVTAADCAPVRVLFRRLYPALSSLVAHLRRTPDHGRNRNERARKRDRTIQR